LEAIGEFFTALVITAFVLAAEILEGLTVGRGKRAIQDMLDLLPQAAIVLRNGDVVDGWLSKPGQLSPPGGLFTFRCHWIGCRSEVLLLPRPLNRSICDFREPRSSAAAEVRSHNSV
jgi:hypothetical protein